MPKSKTSKKTKKSEPTSPTGLPAPAEGNKWKMIGSTVVKPKVEIIEEPVQISSIIEIPAQEDEDVTSS